MFILKPLVCLWQAAWGGAQRARWRGQPLHCRGRHSAAGLAGCWGLAHEKLTVADNFYSALAAIRQQGRGWRVGSQQALAATLTLHLH
jgi:hypothetical protein